MKLILSKVLFLLCISVSIVACKREGCTDATANNYDEKAKKDDGSCLYDNDTTTTGDPDPIDPACVTTINSNSTVAGYGMLAKLPAIWDGPVSETPIGYIPSWIVDFRPISAAQVSAKNEVDADNDVFMSFFIVKHDCKFKLAFRNGGKFGGFSRVTYMVLDNFSETSTESVYTFVEPVSEGNRVRTTVTFKQDSLVMHTFTNKYGTLAQPVTHFIWRAKRKDVSSAQNAITTFNFPQKVLVKDFTTTFDGQSEAIYYNIADDPYSEQEQPYLGKGTVNINVTSPATIDASKKVLISLSTKPLFNGFVFNPASLDTRSRYVFVGAASPISFEFNYMHPGTYYVNAIYDTNGDNNFSSGDYMNSSFDVPLTLADKGTSNTNVTIDFQIP